MSTLEAADAAYQEWPRWLRHGTIDYVIPMAYTDGSTSCWTGKTITSRWTTLPTGWSRPGTAGAGAVVYHGQRGEPAAVLCGLNKPWELKLSNEQLRFIASQIGSDVPFLLKAVMRTQPAVEKF